MKYYELSKEEENIKNDFNDGKLKSVAKLKNEKNRFRQYARAMLNKTKNVIIHLDTHLISCYK
jgi:hypothetical protein